MKKVTIPVKGMHCKACTMLIEDKVGEVKGVKKVRASLKEKSCSAICEDDIDVELLKKAVKEAGYQVGSEDVPLFNADKQVYKDLGVALVFLLALYFILKGLGISQVSANRFGNPSSLLVVLIVGLTAGLSTCMALVGGLILGVSAKYSEIHPEASSVQKFRPHLFFNLGRIASYTLFGGIIGLLGSAFQLSPVVMGLLVILVGVVMFVMGLQLTEIFPAVSRYKVALPKGLARVLGLNKASEKEYSHKNSALLGALTFFLPCGFTQAMQLYAMSTGSFVRGALIMGVFALGTAPGLLGVGGLTSVVKGKGAARFFKGAGILVIVLSFYNISNGLNLSGLKSYLPSLTKVSSDEGIYGGDRTSGSDQVPVPSQPSSGQAGNLPAQSSGSVQVLKATYTADQIIQPKEFKVKADKPVRFEIEAKDDGQGCMGSVTIPGLYRRYQLFEAGKTVVMEFTPQKAGTYQVTCAMGIPAAQLIVE